MQIVHEMKEKKKNCKSIVVISIISSPQTQKEFRDNSLANWISGSDIYSIYFPHQGSSAQTTAELKKC